MSDERPDDGDPGTDDGGVAESPETTRPDAGVDDSGSTAPVSRTAASGDEPSDGRTTDSGGPDDGRPTARGDDGHETEGYTTGERTLDSRVRWLWIGRSLVFAAVVGGLATGVLLTAAPGWLWVGPAVFALFAVLGIGHSALLYRSWSYEVREESLVLDRGVVTRVRTVVPYVRVQHVDTSRGPIERGTGLSSLVVYTAGSRGADVTIPGLTPAEADDLQSRLKVLAIESEGDDAV